MLTGSSFRHGSSFLLRFLVLSTFFVSLQWLQPVLAVQQNRTIDDQGTDSFGVGPVYAPLPAWANQLCNGCATRPDPQKLHNGTATAATFMPEKFPSNTLDFDFNGTAIYIYFTLFYNEGDQVTVNTECNFTLDSEPRVFFNHSGDPTKPLAFRDYNTLVYHKTGLTPEKHHMTISMSDVDYHVFLSFDYALYTVDLALDIPTDTSSGTKISLSTGDARSSTANTLSQTPGNTQDPSSSPTPNDSSPAPGVIAGGVIGGLAVLAGFLLLFYFYRRDIRRSERPASPGPTVPRPFLTTGLTSKQGRSGTSSPHPVPLGNSSASGSSRTRRATPALSTVGLLNMDESTSLTAQTPPSSSGSRSGQVSVEGRIQVATRRMQSLREEIESNSGRAASSRRKNGSVSTSSRETKELLQEVKRLKQEIQLLKESRNSLARAPQPQPSTDYEPPPTYTDDLGHV